MSTRTGNGKADAKQESQFLAAALQKPLTAKRTTPPPLLSVYQSTQPATPLSNATLPSIDLSLAISNFANNASGSSASAYGTPSDASARKRKIADHQIDPCAKNDSPEDRKPEHLVMADMTPPNSIANDDPNEPNHARQDPLQDRIPPARLDPTPRPYQSQCRGN